MRRFSAAPRAFPKNQFVQTNHSATAVYKGLLRAPPGIQGKAAAKHETNSLRGADVSSRTRPRTAAQALVEALVAYGADRVFCVPGESFLAVLDALYDRRDAIATIACRQEGGAAMMAEADGKLTGRPGICMVTRGPGAANASAGLHVAFQDSTPMILFI